MDTLENHGIIIRELRTRKGLSVQKAAETIQKSTGWLCEVENSIGTCRLTAAEFERIVHILGGTKERHMFKTWIANYKNQERVCRTYDGAVLRHVRLKKEMTLAAAAKLLGVSIAYLSRLETGMRPMTLDLRNKIMRAYGYSPSSFKNLGTDPVRSKAVPNRFKFDIFMRKLSAEAAENLFQTALANQL